MSFVKKEECQREHVVVGDCTKRNCTCPKTIFSSHHCIFFFFSQKKKSPCTLSFILSYSKIFSGRNNDECGFGSILLWSAKRKENFHNPQQLRVRDGPPGSSLSQSFATSPHLSQRSEEAGFRGWGGHDATSREFWKALGTYPLPLGAGGGGQAARSCEQWQRDTMQTQFSAWHVSKYTRWRRRRGRFFLPPHFFALLYFRPVLVSKQRFNQNA